ncbi:MAG: cell division protein ZapA [Thermodesulfobacteriota bacterium]
MANRFDVNIAGYALTIQTERSAAHMERLAETLNERVREIQKSGGTANYLNIVMLAAMELADDVLTTGDRMVETRKENRLLEERAARLEEEVRALREKIETLRTEREGIEEKVARKNRDLLAVLENALE